MQTTPYLSDAELFPAIMTVAAAARGTVPAVEGAHAGYGIIDYATLEFWPGQSSPAPSFSVASRTMDECADELEAFHTAHAKGGIAAAHTIDWGKWSGLLTTVLTILKGLGWLAV